MAWTCHLCDPPAHGAGAGRLHHAHYMARHFQNDGPPVQVAPLTPARRETVDAAREAARQAREAGDLAAALAGEPTMAPRVTGWRSEVGRGILAAGRGLVAA